MSKWLKAADGVFLLLDPEDHARFRQFKWRRRIVGKNTYYDRNATVDGRYVKYQLHREIMGARKGDFVSFLSTDFSDLRKSNLVLSKKRLLPRVSAAHAKARQEQEVVDGRIFCPRCNDWMKFYEWSSHGGWRHCAGCAGRSRKRRSEKVRRLVFDHYGRSCSCCGEKHIEFLSIDHKNGDGNKHRAETKCGTGEHFYGWIIRNGYPDYLRVLCLNCNITREHKGYCPHEKERAAAEAAARVSSPDTSSGYPQFATKESRSGVRF